MEHRQLPQKGETSKVFLKFEWTLLILKCGYMSKVLFRFLHLLLRKQSIQFILSFQMTSENISLKCCWDRRFDQITSFSLKALSHSSWHWPAEVQGAGWVSLQGSDEPSWWQTSLSVKISLQFSASALGLACNMMIYTSAIRWQNVRIHSYSQFCNVKLWVVSKLWLAIHTVPEQSQRRFPEGEAIICSQHAEVGCFHIGIGSLRKRRKCYDHSPSFLFCREVRTTKSRVTFFRVLYIEFGSSFKRLTWRSVRSRKSD